MGAGREFDLIEDRVQFCRGDGLAQRKDREQMLEGPQVEMQMSAGQAQAALFGAAQANLVPEELKSLVRGAVAWQRLFQKPAALVLPFQVEFK